MFEINSYKKRFDANKVELVEKGFPYIVRTSLNNGLKGYILENVEFLNDGNTISFGQDTATMFYQEKPYFTGDKIKILKPKFAQLNKITAHFFISTMTKSFSSFSWGSSSFNVEIIKKQKVTLPVDQNNQIDFAFMESFVAELEVQRVAELEAYLNATGLTDYTLTEDEQKALERFEKGEVEFEEVNIIDYFTIKNSGNILAKDIVENSGNIPYLSASKENNAVSSYILYNEKFIDKGNCVFIGGKTFVVSYQEKDFFSNDSHNLSLYLIEREKQNRFTNLCFATCINKSLRPLYSWDNSISKAKIKKDKISLPTTATHPDYAFMQTLISAVQKLVIADVVRYADRKIAATKAAAGEKN